MRETQLIRFVNIFDNYVPFFCGIIHSELNYAILHLRIILEAFVVAVAGFKTFVQGKS